MPAAWTLAARAQRQKVPVIGTLNPVPEAPDDFLRVAFRRGLAEQGYSEGRNIQILHRWAENRYERLPALAADLVKHQVALIATSGSPSTLAAQSATATIPIVFAIGADPVELGLVPSLNHPGSNITGASYLTTTLAAKRLELLHELSPSTRSIGYLVNPANAGNETEVKEVEAAAHLLGVSLVTLNASSGAEIDEAFASLADRRIGAILVGADSLFNLRHEQLAVLAARHAVPAIHQTREYVEDGGLMSYGASMSDAWRLAGIYAGRILKGEKPADLPVQQSTKIDMVLNLRTAKALGIEVPTATLLRATEVIE